MNPPLADIQVGLRDPLIHELLQGEDELVASNLDLEVVTWGKPELLVNLLRNCDLTTDTDLDRVHGDPPEGWIVI